MSRILGFQNWIKVASGTMQRGASEKRGERPSLWRDFERFCFPSVCRNCRRNLDPMNSEDRWCSECRIEIAGRTRQFCGRCGAVLAMLSGHEAEGGRLERNPPPMINSGCCYCQHLAFPFQDVVSVGNYEGRLRRAIMRVKSSLDEPLMFGLAEEMAERIEAQHWFARLDGIVAVPSYWLRRLKRGFHVSYWLATSLASRWNCPYFHGAIGLNRATRKQGLLTMRQRRLNLKHAMRFRNQPRHEGAKVKEVLLVDDVMTSGATACEATRVLKKHFCEVVHVAVIARGVRGDSVSFRRASVGG